MPSRPAARHTSAGSPVGSAAASSSSRRVSAGSASIRRRKLSSMLPESVERHRAGQPEPAGQLRRRQTPRQLQQGQRVAMRLGDDLIADPRIHRPGQRRVQQRPRIVLPQPLDHKFRQSRQVTGRDTGPEHQADRLRPQPAGDEREDLRRGAVEPLLVIDDAHQRPFPGQLGQQAQDGQADQKPVRRRPGTEAERGPQRVALRRRETLQAVQHRRAQLVQHRERQLHLRLDTHRARHPAARRLPGQVLQQRGLAHPRLAVHHQTPAFTRTHRRHQPVEHVAFGAAAGQLRHRPRPGKSAGTCTALTLLPGQRTGHSD